VRLKGSIKNHWSHFQVNEIDVDGHVVELTGHEIPATATVTDKRPAKKPKVDCDQEQQSCLPFAENHHVTLASALSESVAQQIDVFASLYSVELSVKETDKISVGVVNEKQTRTTIHTSIRQLYPWLKTETKTSSTGDKEIFVMYDEDYSKVARLVSREEADRLLVFLKCPRDNLKAVQLNPDDNKEHRQKVHRLIAELFGHFSESKTHVPNIHKQNSRASDSITPCIHVRLKQNRRRRKLDSCNDADESDGTNNTGFVLRKWNIVSAVSFANALGNNDYKFCTLD
jgi:hypothetical protein